MLDEEACENSDAMSTSASSSDLTHDSGSCGDSHRSLGNSETIDSRDSLSLGLGQEAHKTVVKVHSRILCPDVEYKTLSISRDTNCKQVISQLLTKFRMTHRDPNLFYLTMEVWIRNTGIPIRSVMVLDEKACPAYLQACCPHQETKFTMMMRRGGLVKVYDSCLMSGAMYKSVLLSDRTNVEELIHLLVNCTSHQSSPQQKSSARGGSNSSGVGQKYNLYEVCPAKNCERKLHAQELPLRIQLEWPTQDLVFFELRKDTQVYPRIVHRTYDQRVSLRFVI